MTDVRDLVRVKPLVWEDVREGIKCHDTSGLYVVRLAVAGRTSRYSLTRANRFVGDLFDTIADAMAAAEADHEARAYGDLIPATDGRAPAWQPPPESERQDCFTCLGWHPHGEWQAVMWIKYMAAWWWVFDDAKASPTHFLPMPPAPAQEGEP